LLLTKGKGLLTKNRSQIHIKGKWKFIKIIDEDIDLCDISSENGGDVCPITPDSGEEKLIVIKKLINRAPTGARFTITVRLINHQGYELLCFKFPVKIY
jgi:hypothetical protein